MSDNPKFSSSIGTLENIRRFFENIEQHDYQSVVQFVERFKKEDVCKFLETRNSEGLTPFEVGQNLMKKEINKCAHIYSIFNYLRIHCEYPKYSFPAPDTDIIYRMSYFNSPKSKQSSNPKSHQSYDPNEQEVISSMKELSKGFDDNSNKNLLEFLETNISGGFSHEDDASQITSIDITEGNIYPGGTISGGANNYRNNYQFGGANDSRRSLNVSGEYNDDDFNDYEEYDDEEKVRQANNKIYGYWENIINENIQGGASKKNNQNESNNQKSNQSNTQKGKQSNNQSNTQKGKQRQSNKQENNQSDIPPIRNKELNKTMNRVEKIFKDLEKKKKISGGGNGDNENDDNNNNGDNEETGEEEDIDYEELLSDDDNTFWDSSAANEYSGYSGGIIGGASKEFYEEFPKLKEIIAKKLNIPPKHAQALRLEMIQDIKNIKGSKIPDLELLEELRSIINDDNRLESYNKPEIIDKNLEILKKNHQINNEKRKNLKAKKKQKNNGSTNNKTSSKTSDNDKTSNNSSSNNKTSNKTSGNNKTSKSGNTKEKKPKTEKPKSIKSKTKSSNNNSNGSNNSNVSGGCGYSSFIYPAYNPMISGSSMIGNNPMYGGNSSFGSNLTGGNQFGSYPLYNYPSFGNTPINGNYNPYSYPTSTI